MPEFHNNLWAPWRMEYIRSLDQHEKAQGCFLCGYRDAPDQDEGNRVLWRTQSSFVVMNRFPYTNGHLLVAGPFSTRHFLRSKLATCPLPESAVQMTP